MHILDNSSFAAFVGALVAFLLVYATDWRRRKRQKKLLGLLVSDNISLANDKLDTIQTNMLMVKRDNQITGAPVMKFPIGSIRETKFLVLDLLSRDQSQGIEVLIYWMESLDELISESMTLARKIKALGRSNAPAEEVDAAANDYLVTLEECEVNLKHFCTLAGYYVANEPEKIFSFRHPVGNTPSHNN